MSIANVLIRFDAGPRLFEPGAIYIFDRAYVDFERLFRLHQALAFFVTRAKKNLDFRWLRSQPFDPATGVLTNPQTASVRIVQIRPIVPNDAHRQPFFTETSL